MKFGGTYGDNTPEFAPERFNPDMLIMAREASGLTQSEVAEKLNIHQNEVSRWEAGIRFPSFDDVNMLAEVLDRRMGFFYRSDRPLSAEVAMMFHRKRAKTKVSTLKKLHAKINIYRIATASVCRQFKAWDVQLPRFDLEEFSSPSEVAARVRSIWQVPDGPIFNLVSLIEATGCCVIYFDFETEDVDAIGLRPIDSIPIFFVNTTAPSDRIRFSVAHELAHLVLHEWPTETMEDEADEFAAAFLVPAQSARLELKDVSSVNVWGLKQRWRVSAQCLIRRARDCGLMDQARFVSLMSYFSKSGWRKREPYPIAPEAPGFFQRLVDTCFSSLKLSRDEIGELTGFSDTELEAYLPSQNPKPKLKLFKSNPKKAR